MIETWKSSVKSFYPRQDFLLFSGRHLHSRVCLHCCQQGGLSAVLRLPRQETEDCESTSLIRTGFLCGQYYKEFWYCFSFLSPFYFSKIKFLINVWNKARPDFSATSCFRLKPPLWPSPRPLIWHSIGGNREPSLQSPHYRIVATVSVETQPISTSDFLC